MEEMEQDHTAAHGPQEGAGSRAGAPVLFTQRTGWRRGFLVGPGHDCLFEIVLGTEELGRN